MSAGMNLYKQGDMVVVRFPFTDGSQFKKRPALVISNDLVNDTGDYLLVQITSKYHADGLSIEIEDTDVLRPLALRSYVRSHKLFTVNESLILSKITVAQTHFVTKVAAKIYNLIDTI
jgi:mRNA interferase MazF